MKKYKKGYTTGVFDMFHIGHLNILEKAKQQCETMVVGVSTDELVLSYKKKKTIIPFAERIKIVQAIRYVDEVVPQKTMDKLEQILALDCDAVFVGSDWQGSEKWIQFEKEFAGHGVDVVYLPYTKGTSSTILREVLEKHLNKGE